MCCFKYRLNSIEFESRFTHSSPAPIPWLLFCIYFVYVRFPIYHIAFKDLTKQQFPFSIDMNNLTRSTIPLWNLHWSHCEINKITWKCGKLCQTPTITIMFIKLKWIYQYFRPLWTTIVIFFTLFISVSPCVRVVPKHMNHPKALSLPFSLLLSLSIYRFLSCILYLHAIAHLNHSYQINNCKSFYSETLRFQLHNLWETILSNLSVVVIAQSIILVHYIEFRISYVLW